MRVVKGATIKEIRVEAECSDANLRPQTNINLETKNLREFPDQQWEGESHTSDLEAGPLDPREMKVLLEDHTQFSLPTQCEEEMRIALGTHVDQAQQWRGSMSER